MPTPNLAHTLVSACQKRRNIYSYRLTTCYGIHRKTSSVSFRPHSSAHSGDSSTQCPTLPSSLSIRSFTWQGLETSSWSSSHALDRPTPQRHWISSCQLLETGRPSYGWSDATARAGYAMTTTTTSIKCLCMDALMTETEKTGTNARRFKTKIYQELELQHQDLGRVAPNKLKFNRIAIIYNWHLTKYGIGFCCLD